MGDKPRRRGWVDLPSLSAFPLVLLSILVGENAHPPQRRTKAPTPRFAVPEVHGCHSVRREGTNRPRRADTAILVLGLCVDRTIGRETLPGNQRSGSFPRNFFEKIILSRNPFLLFYAAYFFPSRCFQNRTFLRYSVSGEGSLFLLSFVLLIYFLPISWRGPPPPDGGRQRSGSELFFMTTMAAQHGGECVILYIADPFSDPEWEKNCWKLWRQ